MPVDNDIREKINAIIQGNEFLGEENYLTAARNFLWRRFKANTKVKGNFESESIIKEEQGVLLTQFTGERDFASNNVDLTKRAEK